MINAHLKELNNKRNRAYVRACLHAPLIDIAEEMLNVWKQAYTGKEDAEREGDITLAFESNTIDCVAVNLHLSSNDSMLGGLVEQILNMALYNDMLELYKQSDYMELQWRSWDFLLTSAKSNKYPYNKVKLMVRFWYGNSRSCRQVDSGETMPVMKVVCE